MSCGVWVRDTQRAFAQRLGTSDVIRRKGFRRWFRWGNARVVIRTMIERACLSEWYRVSWRSRRRRGSIANSFWLLVAGREDSFARRWCEMILCRKCRSCLRLLTSWIRERWIGILLKIMRIRCHSDSGGTLCFIRLRFECLLSSLLRSFVILMSYSKFNCC